MSSLLAEDAGVAPELWSDHTRAALNRATQANSLFGRLPEDFAYWTNRWGSDGQGGITGEEAPGLRLTAWRPSSTRVGARCS